ncbi:MAG: LacI family transcriptional regulator [Brooklawnia sp.]|nr:LacI family transcriptional regulator [Brooklawnia sp.]
MSRTTINDIAALAGVSKGTVSRVLNGHPRVSERSREAVWRAIEQTGYRANVHARSLATGRNNAIALLIAAASDQLFSDPTFAELIEGVRDGLLETDLSLVILMGGSETEDHRTVSYIKAGHVDGLIHLNPFFDDAITAGLPDCALPLVLCGPRPPIPLPRQNWVVTLDDAGGVRQALDHLASRGAHKIAMIGGDPRGVSATVRFQAYRDWLGASFDPDLFEPGDYGAGSGQVALARILDRHPRVDAVFCASDRMAIGALETAYRRGLHVPEDLLVMGFDDHRIAALADPPLSTIRQPIREIGRTAVQTLLAAIAGETPSDKVFPTHLVVRDST